MQDHRPKNNFRSAHTDLTLRFVATHITSLASVGCIIDSTILPDRRRDYSSATITNRLAEHQQFRHVAGSHRPHRLNVQVPMHQTELELKHYGYVGSIGMAAFGAATMAQWSMFVGTHRKTNRWRGRRAAERKPAADAPATARRRRCGCRGRPGLLLSRSGRGRPAAALRACRGGLRK